MSTANSELTDIQRIEQALEDLRNSNNYNTVLHKVKVVSASKEKVVYQLLVEKEHVNSKNTLHGGLAATITDTLTSRAVRLHFSGSGGTGASVELSLSYFLPVSLGDTVEITAIPLKIGRTLAFAEAEFRDLTTGKLCIKGKHTMAIFNDSSSK